jgi:hypothetical protein
MTDASSTENSALGVRNSAGFSLPGFVWILWLPFSQGLLLSYNPRPWFLDQFLEGKFQMIKFIGDPLDEQHGKFTVRSIGEK